MQAAIFSRDLREPAIGAVNCLYKLPGGDSSRPAATAKSSLLNRETTASLFRWFSTSRMIAAQDSSTSYGFREAGFCLQNPASLSESDSSGAKAKNPVTFPHHRDLRSRRTSRAWT